ncbi:DUF6090 family protein [Geojedonia litorea]|uniref:DUF6090 family protein n=1 Tax=Geojedonia litorea TaxID=1268269 RepID=A0ABV9MXZ4_9FLAO
MENKTSKYFKYAIGEIILVVIGILIALSINNWNENQKLKSNEKELLVYVLENLKEDSLIIHNALTERISILEVHQQLVAYLNNELSRDEVGDLDLLRRSFPGQLITRKNNPELSKNVLDQGVKKQILEYYRSIDRAEFIMANHNNIIENVVRPYLGQKGLLTFGNHVGNFEDDTLDLIDRDLFFEEIKNKAFQQILFESGIKANSIINWETHASVENEKLKISIKNYLSKK